MLSLCLNCIMLNHLLSSDSCNWKRHKRPPKKEREMVEDEYNTLLTTALGLYFLRWSRGGGSVGRLQSTTTARLHTNTG